jgi:hypothetical protein
MIDVPKNPLLGGVARSDGVGQILATHQQSLDRLIPKFG